MWVGVLCVSKCGCGKESEVKEKVKEKVKAKDRREEGGRAMR